MFTDQQIRAIKRTLAVVIVTLIVFHLLGQFSAHILDRRRLLGFVAMFRLQSEHNAPAYYSGLQLLAAALLLFVIAKHAVARSLRSALPWLGLGAMFCYLAVDEVTMIHENFGALGKSFSIFDGLKYKWVVMGFVLVVAVVALFFKFWLRLPGRTRLWFAVSAAVYIGGAIGFETISGLYANRYSEDFGFSVLILFEEGMEIIGIAMFLMALVRYMHDHYDHFGVRPADTQAEALPDAVDHTTHRTSGAAG